MRRLAVACLLALACLLHPGSAQASILDRLLPWFSGTIETQGLAIHWGGTLTADRVDLRDSHGVYATLTNVRIEWSPLRLIRGVTDVSLLSADRAEIMRLPESSGGGSGSSEIAIKELKIDRLDVDQPVAGAAVALKVEGSAQRKAADQANATITAQRIGGEGIYHLQASLEPSVIQADVTAQEAPGGPIAALAHLPDLGRISVNASVKGPRTDLDTKLSVHAGQLQADAHGQVNLEASALTLTVNASAPAMTPRPDIAWQSIVLSADVTGEFSRPDVKAQLAVEGLTASGASVQRLGLHVAGNQGAIDVNGELDGVQIPGRQPDLLAGAPLILTAQARLDAPDRPVSFTLHHPAIDASGKLQTATVQRADIRVTIPQIGPFAAEAGADLQGNLLLTVSALRTGDNVQASVDATLGVTGGTAPAPALIGPSAHLVLVGGIAGTSITLSRLDFNGQNLALNAGGSVAPERIDLSWSADLAHLAAIDPRLDGTLSGRGRVGGAEQDITLAADLTGSVSLHGQSSGPLTAHLEAQGLPRSPSGQVSAEGSLLGSPLRLAASGTRQGDGTLHVSIQQADWKSASAQGSLTLPAGATVPVGSLQVAVQHLADFAPLIGQPLAGSARATLDATSTQATISAEATGMELLPTASIAQATLHASIADPTTRPVVDGTLVLDRFAASGLAGSAHLTVKGPSDALGVQLGATLPSLDGAAARLATSGTIDAPARAVTVASLSGEWKQHTIRLLQPSRLVFINGVGVQDLRLGLDRAVLQADGHVGSTLDLTASARDVPVALVALVSPKLPATGMVSAEARLTGTPSSPTGSIRTTVTGLQLDTAEGRKLPPAAVTASAQLQGSSAQIDAKMSAGGSVLTLAGRAPFTTTAPLNLRANGSVDLALADPFFGPTGGLEGRATLNADVSGTATHPGGTIRARATGVRLSNPTGRALPPASINAVATLEGNAARIDARLAAATSHLEIAGRAPFGTTQPLDLRTTGTLDLGILDPILTASGQRVTGRVTLAAGIAGTAAAPRVTGTAQLSNGDIRDYVQGVHLREVTARLTASGDTVSLQSFTARAGDGTLAGNGTIGILAPAIPVNLTFTAHDATPLSGGVVTATMNANLAIRGDVRGQVALAGRIDVRQATIRIPAKLPVSVATIPVRIAGAPPAPAPKPGLSPVLAMDLTVSAPQQVFLRGRGLNAELGGTIHVQGTNQQMLPRGSFRLIRGSFNLVGTTLEFTSGEISFNGGSITDPALHLVATSSSAGATSTLTVGGTAQNPKVTLSSVPELPQDQILARLLFHTDSGHLSPFQIASIAAGLAELSGSTSNFPNPLLGVQNALGLDQLGIGSGANGTPTLQAGRYIGRRLYVGAQESVSGAGAQGTIQYSLTEGLKLNATVGAGQTTSAIGATGESNGASVGITYQFQY